MKKLFKRIKDGLRLWFWDRITIQFSHSNSDLALVTIYPRLLSRIFNHIDVGKHWCERNINGKGYTSWISYIDKSRALVVHDGYVLHRLLEKAYVANCAMSDKMPDATLLSSGAAVPNKKEQPIDVN